VISFRTCHVLHAIIRILPHCCSDYTEKFNNVSFVFAYTSNYDNMQWNIQLRVYVNNILELPFFRDILDLPYALDKQQHRTVHLSATISWHHNGANKSLQWSLINLNYYRHWEIPRVQMVLHTHDRTIRVLGGRASSSTRWHAADVIDGFNKGVILSVKSMEKKPDELRQGRRQDWSLERAKPYNF
jgi:hypothetical protein